MLLVQCKESELSSSPPSPVLPQHCSSCHYSTAYVLPGPMRFYWSDKLRPLEHGAAAGEAMFFAGRLSLP